jgi:aspartate 1-decarboxylase
MKREMLRAKLHRATVTQTELAYDGSLTLDSNLMEAVDLKSFEKVDVYNVDTGGRFSTYVIPGEAGSGTVCVNGAAARLATPGDKIIIAAYATYEEAELSGYAPKVVLLGEKNIIRSHEASGTR